MTDTIRYKSFDAATVKLGGSNLIEASAGTGKTYSIAILVLRLILEQKITIKEILMVTFTKTAVAELEDRIRYFVRSAYKVSLGKEIGDDNIKKLVSQAIDKSGVKQVQQQLKDTVLFLDETSVLTIHSFCQQTLNEFAFETNQLFGAEMLADIKSVIEEELNKCWRKNITTMPLALLEAVWNDGLKGGMMNAIEAHLSGKKYFGYDESVNYTITKALQQQWIEMKETLEQKQSEMREALVQHVIDNTASIISTANSNTYAKKNVISLIESPKEFLDFLWEKRNGVNIKKTFPDLLLKLTDCDQCLEDRNEHMQIINSHLNCLAIQEVSKGVKIFKMQNNLLSYDDMIQNLHKALVERNNPVLVTALRTKYKAVFVDEFQDTDRNQFEIFDKAFGENTILFYIGDPKQSIYAFRKADIFTYFKARNQVQNIYDMNYNYRSSASLIAAMNQFFLPIENFDTFFFDGEDEAILYHPVESPEPNTRGNFLKGKAADVPVSIFSMDNNDVVNHAVAAQVARLLRPGAYSITAKGETRNVNPSDIGILVRTGKQGRTVKGALARLGIPAVTIDDSKVLQSAEARRLLYLMEAIASPDRSTINRALLSPFTGLGTDAILLLDDEITLELFNSYKLRWQRDGVYTALMNFVTDFGVRMVLLQGHTESGERIMTNLFQLAEILHQVQSRKNLSMVELISWLKRGLNGMVNEGDEYLQRVESDEEAVKIVTIHKSKGLEYNIVLAPFLDIEVSSKHDFFSFRNPDTGEYSGVEKARVNGNQQAWYSRQAEQENRRLVYVAITRAVYKCFIFRNEYFKSSTLATFLHALNTAEPHLIHFEQGIPSIPEQPYRKIKSTEPVLTKEPVHFSLLEQNWRKMSYTMLAAKGDIALRTRSYKYEDAYETFILHTLKRGAKTGNLLHYIFENSNFADEKRWTRVLEEAIRRFVPGQQELYLPMLQQLLQHVFNTDILISGVRFNLAAVDFNKRIAEFEFDLPVPEFIADTLNNLSNEWSNVTVKGFQDLNSRQLEGIMNGKMDLFFEHLGRYYILDWKSNYLGPTTEDYTADALALAMNESNYHLQYLIYTLAAKKYLESRMAEFDYETQFGGVIYLFVRGMRYGSDAGIFTSKPSMQRIAQLENILMGVD
ncbi:MAG: exodeoxyribonuclease V subunit beta [Chitinophagaceae bacterium]